MRIFSANILTMLSSIVIGFVVPAVLSVESYSLVKTYGFYLTYIGLFHFGYIDGMYIKYGGKDIDKINKSDYQNEHHVFIVFQLLITLFFIVVSFFIKDIIVFFMAISILPINTVSFYNLFYQATGQFKLYAKYSYIYTIFHLILNIILALVLKNNNYILYCLTNLISYMIVFIFMEYNFYKEMKEVKVNFSLKSLLNIKVGIPILIGNLSVVLFYALDRWFIKIFFDLRQFGYYSFAISMLSIINVLVNAISVTFYNYLSAYEDRDRIKEMKKYFIILGSLASCGYFPLAGIVNIFLPKYIPSLDIISISFAAYPYMIVIKTLYVNLYKARKMTKRYVSVVFLIVLISVIYNLIAVLIFKNPEAIAMATTLSFITWYFYSMKDFKYTKSNLKEIIYLVVSLMAFLLSSHVFPWVIGGVVYLIIIIVLLICLYGKELKNKIYYNKNYIIGDK